ncbi:glycosyltransferase [Cytophagaceae bacterium ABcell3]|nr:glycosyltransferase [Cytophagaceae bacterium ABcell3]
MHENKKILIVTIPEKGHINPMIGIAKELQNRGYELAFFAQTNIKEQVVKAGLDVPVFFNSLDKDGLVTKGKTFVEKLQDKAWLQNWIKTLLIDAVPSQVQVIEDVVKQYCPALIVTDPMVYAAAIVANQHQIPWVGVSSSLNPVTPDKWECDLTMTLQTFAQDRNEIFQKYLQEARFRVSDLISPWLNIVFSTEEYAPRSFSNNTFSFYVGHSFPDGDRGDEQDFPFHLLRKDSKKVYMSLGSQVYYHPKLFAMVQQAMQGSDVQLIFSMNELVHTPFVKTLNENVIAVEYAPQLRLLPHIDLMISHGGANSVMECLAHGKPIALLPICNDQFLQAKFVAYNKAGKIFDTYKATVEDIRAGLHMLLEDDAEERKNALKIADSFARHQGPFEAAVLIEKLFCSRTPLMPLV